MGLIIMIQVCVHVLHFIHPTLCFFLSMLWNCLLSIYRLVYRPNDIINSIETKVILYLSKGIVKFFWKWFYELLYSEIAVESNYWVLVYRCEYVYVYAVFFFFLFQIFGVVYSICAQIHRQKKGFLINNHGFAFFLCAHHAYKHISLVFFLLHSIFLFNWFKHTDTYLWIYNAWYDDNFCIFFFQCCVSSSSSSSFLSFRILNALSFISSHFKGNLLHFSFYLVVVACYKKKKGNINE